MLKKFLMIGQHDLRSLETAALDEYTASRTSFAVSASYSTKESLYTWRNEVGSCLLKPLRRHVDESQTLCFLSLDFEKRKDVFYLFKILVANHPCCFSGSGVWGWLK